MKGVKDTKIMTHFFFQESQLNERDEHFTALTTAC